MRKLGTIAVLVLSLAACSDERAAMHDFSTVTSRAQGGAPAEEAAPAAMDAASDARGGEGGAVSPQPPGSDNPSAGTPMLAYIYGVSIELPARAVRTTMGKHEQACRAAGPAVCQVLGASVNASDDEQNIYGSIQLRAQPRWLETFRARLDAEARGAGGRVRETSVSSEDLTRQIVDTDARLRAQKVLRERLQQLLRTRPGKLEELLATERALAEVQGQIDSAESQLAVMRQRVATSLVNLNYQSKANAVTGGTFEPVAEAFAAFFGIVAQGIGFIIRLIAFLIPVALVLVPLGWLGLRWRRQRRARKAVETTAGGQ